MATTLANTDSSPVRFVPLKNISMFHSYIRGLGIAQGKTVDVVTTHTDIFPTLFELAGIKQRSDFDGSPIPVTPATINKELRQKKRDHVNVEFWGVGIEEGFYATRG